MVRLYHVGSLYGRLEIKDAKAEYAQVSESEEVNCHLKFVFDKNTIAIESVSGYYNCGFGQGVYADETYARQKQQVIDHSNSGESRKIYFKQTSPEAYGQ